MHEDLLRQIYAAFNRRDIEGVLATMTDDVEWPNVMEGTRIRGHAAVRDYWTHQFAQISPTVEPTAFAERPDGSTAVTVHQTVRDKEGNLLHEGTVTHVYRFTDDRVKGMEVESQEDAEAFWANRERGEES